MITGRRSFLRRLAAIVLIPSAVALLSWKDTACDALQEIKVELITLDPESGLGGFFVARRTISQQVVAVAKPEVYESGQFAL